VRPVGVNVPTIDVLCHDMCICIGMYLLSVLLTFLVVYSFIGAFEIMINGYG